MPTLKKKSSGFSALPSQGVLLSAALVFVLPALAAVRAEAASVTINGGASATQNELRGTAEQGSGGGDEFVQTQSFAIASYSGIRQLDATASYIVAGAAAGSLGVNRTFSSLNTFNFVDSLVSVSTTQKLAGKGGAEAFLNSALSAGTIRFDLTGTETFKIGGSFSPQAGLDIDDGFTGGFELGIRLPGETNLTASVFSRSGNYATPGDSFSVPTESITLSAGSYEFFYLFTTEYSDGLFTDGEDDQITSTGSAFLRLDNSVTGEALPLPTAALGSVVLMSGMLTSRRRR